MNIPIRDRRTKEDIIEYMNTCAKQYVPEWRYDSEHPDAGTALVSLFADMMYDNIRRFNRSAAMDMISFFDELHVKMLPSRPAEGFITFELPAGLESEKEVPAGTRLLADTPEEQLIFETQEEVLVRQMNIGSIYLSNPYEDAVYQIYDRKEENMPSFFLFRNGEQNLQRHSLFFCFDRGLDILTEADAHFTLEIGNSDIELQKFTALFSDPSVIRFSYGTGEGYREIVPGAMADGGASMPEDEEDAPAPGISFTIEGGEEGIADMEEFGNQYVIRANILDSKLLSQTYIRTAALTLKSRGRKPELIHVNGSDQEPEEFLVFGENPAVYNECYIASREVFGKAGAHIKVEFDLDFVKIPLEMQAEEKNQWKTVMLKRNFIPDKEYDITIHEVTWEYFNGYGWTRLAVPGACRKIFSAGGDAGIQQGRRIRLEFICPDDMRPVLINSLESCYIRARIVKMNNAFKTKGAYIAPVAGGFMLSYNYEEAPLAPAQILTQNNMETCRFGRETLGQRGAAFPMSVPNPDEKTSCYLGFEEPPAGNPLKMLFVMHDTMQENMPEIGWEYLGKNGWKRINLIDGTGGFHHTGLVSWSGSPDIQKKILFGRELYWIRLMDMENAYQRGSLKEQCPKIDGIYPNSTSILGIETIEETYAIAPREEEKVIELSYSDVADIQIQVLERMDYERTMVQKVWETWAEVPELTDEAGREYVIHRQEGRIEFPKYMNTACLNEQGEIEVRVRYGRCRGEKGNLEAGRINRLGQTVGFISQCGNPVASLGGVSRERMGEAVRRNAQKLRHGGRCVSAGDYEAMAWEAARDVSRIKCFSGYDKNRNRQPGAVTLVVLPKDYEDNSYSFERTKMQIYDSLSGHMDENILSLGKFYIVKPEMIRLDVKVFLEPVRKQDIFGTKKRVLEELERFLDPLHGGFYGKGWEIGTLPDKNQIIHALKSVDGVKHISQLILRKYRRGRFEDIEISDEMCRFSYLLPESGSHEVII